MPAADSEADPIRGVAKSERFLGLQGKRGIRIELGCSIAGRGLLTQVLLGTIMSVSALLVPVDDIRAIEALSLSCLLPT
jgi:hypothetical protein